jgi:ATP-binding cassette, subfamily C, bacterial CydD
LLGTRFHAGLSGVAAAQRIFEILDTPTLPRSSREPQRNINDSSAFSALSAVNSIRFDDVSYAYDGERSALKGVTFEIKAGQKVALIGPTGSGKSTIANLLLRFIEAERGEITIDGMPLRSLPADEWRKQIAWVPQQPYLFNETVAANIRLARAAASMDEVIEAAQLAHADEFIRDLPQGYETVIGERGARLSGGQAQRLALARAFLKAAPLLIMDEATSSLDVENEALLQDAIDRLLQAPHCTALIITHRLSTITRADQIVVLTEGRVAEAGTHESLLQQHSLYYRLVTAGKMTG